MTRAARLTFVVIALTLIPASARGEPGPPSEPAGVLTHRTLHLRAGRGARAPASTSFVVTLPKGARQGVGRWYLMRLKGLFALAPGGAASQVSMSINGATALQLIVRHGRRGSADNETATVDQLDLLEGEAVHPVFGARATIDESNYVQLQGLHGGTNTITVADEGIGGAPLVSSVEVLPGSGIYESALGPSTLHIGLSHKLRIDSNTTTRVPTVISDSGDDARHTVIRIASDSANVTVLGRPEVPLGTVKHDKPVKVSFLLKTGRAGTGTVTLSAASTASQPEASATISIGDQHPRTSAEVLTSLVLFLPMIGFLLLALRSPRRRS